MSGLVFDSIRVQFGDTEVVRGVSLDIAPGTVVGLVGESGSGKSTLARAAVGLAPVHAGKVTIGGEDVRQNPSRAGLQMVFQDPFGSLDPRMRIESSIREPMRGNSSKHAKGARVAELLKLVGLSPEMGRARPGKLSGGQRQRVAIARALAADPRFLIADEVTSALDVSVQGAILNLLRELQDTLQLGMLFISHNIAVVHYVSDEVVVMRAGEIVEAGSAEDVLDRPKHPYTQELVAVARSGAV